MTDAELAEYLHLTPAEAGLIIPRLPLEIARGAYRRTKQQVPAPRSCSYRKTYPAD